MCCLRSTTVKFCGEERFPKSTDDIMDWFYSMPRESIKTGKWECSHSEFVSIVKMRDSLGQYLYDIERKRVLGCPVIVDGENEPSGK